MNFSRVCSAIGAGLAALALVSGNALGGLLFEEDPDWKESEVTMPPPVDDARLRPFFVSSASPNSFFVDEGSLSVGEDRVVRYTLVVRTPGGAENITYEGLRCATGERRIYASGRRNGEWTPMKKSDWQPINDNAYNRPRAALAYDHFCDGPAAPRDLEHALRLLRSPFDASRTYGVR
ncbi:CNP1-like family protein [Thauera sp.]|uniref:CNP1-like family protein n=1 Tax=Thauera sp. TaxID=1905334 RepID=UPI0039E6FC48